MQKTIWNNNSLKIFYDKIIYDFNTLTASVTIKDGLVIDSHLEAVSLDNDILSILTNSAF